MALPAEKKMTAWEYLEAEETATEKHEFINGDIYLMSGGTVNHNQIAANALVGLTNKLGKKPCRVFNSDQKVYIDFFDAYTYPDVTIVCGKPELLEGRNDVITNPIVLVEVLSDSTEAFDRGDKFTFYRSIPGLKEYLLIAQDKHQVEHYCKVKRNEWLLTEFRSPDDVIPLPALEIELTMSEIYRLVEWDAP